VISGLRSIIPKRNERSILVGKTGTGKTTLAMEILQAYTFVLAIDPIHVLREKLPKEYVLCKSPKQLAWHGRSHKKLLYQPDPDFFGWEWYNEVYELAFHAGNRMVYTDEGLRVMRPNGQAPPYMEACYTAGRQKGVGMITCSQRPAKIDLRVMSEAEHYYAFRLRLREDRERMASLMHEDVLHHPPKGHSFHYWRDSDEHLGLYTLSLED